MDLKVKLPPAQVSVDTFRNTCDMWLSGKRYIKKQSKPSIYGDAMGVRHGLNPKWTVRGHGFESRHLHHMAG